MRNKTSVDLEIERRIAERDRLLLRAQRKVGGAAPIASELMPSTELLAFVQRIAHLELALSRYLDAAWIAAASTEELILNARDALEVGEPAESGADVLTGLRLQA
ncbi:MAG: hypothetical protein ABJD07_01000 [Gemmatimonadaceae bacterium]